ncbi:peptidylprolyl isomerase [Marinifilum sp.]|uniref:peptidylprolyl isomerase n=1 Tax=Marinifilum sp. TaxID=2033137 RepID=UPI003BAAC262
MRKGLLYLITVLYCSLASYGQYNPSDTLFSINGKPYPSAPFAELFESNKLLDQHNQALPLAKALDLYIDFHLKALEAKNLRFDTIPKVIQEIKNYHNQAFFNYLYPFEISDQLITETFNRIQHFVKVRHILIKIEGRATPKDTLKAYNEANRIYALLKRGKKFSKLANMYSDDLSARKNNGELGYITVFDMEYALENAAYNTPVGEFSKPVRSQYGYHIVQTTEKIKNPGRIKIRHLMLEFKKKNEREVIKIKADSIYNLLQNGANFSELIHKYSDDVSSAKDGGILPWFGLFEIHPEIEKAAFLLKKTHDYSLPVKTEFGYHILQLLDRKEYNSYESCKNELLSLLEEDDRSRKSKRELIEELKLKYNYKENRKHLSNFYSILDYAYAELWEPLISIDGKNYSQEKFAEFLSKQESKDIYENFREYINRLYVDFTNRCILAYHKKKLVKENPELERLLNEYEKGVLVYYITKSAIWNKEVANDNNLRKFFDQNPEKYKNNLDFNKVRKRVLLDYREHLEMNWSKKLREKYSVTIKKATVNKIAILKNE